MRRRKNLTLNTLAEFFFKQEKVLTEQEYSSLKQQPVYASNIRKYFGSYTRMLTLLESHSLWPELQAMRSKPAPVVKPTTAKTTKKVITEKPVIKPKKVVKEDDSE